MSKGSSCTSIIPDREIPYDYLIVATGSHHAYFGHDEWEPVAPGLKAIEDATELADGFSSRSSELKKLSDPKEREAYLTFVIVGGGPNGDRACPARCR